MLALFLCITIFTGKTVFCIAPISAIEDLEDIPVGEPVQVEGGLVVTVLKKPKKCIRQVNITTIHLKTRSFSYRPPLEITFLYITLGD